MRANKPQTISLDQFKKKFTEQQLRKIEEEVAYYDVLIQLRNVRERAGLTQEQLAKKADINRTTLSKIESGVRNATIGTLLKLSKAMNVTMEINFH